MCVCVCVCVYNIKVNMSQVMIIACGVFLIFNRNLLEFLCIAA